MSKILCLHREDLEGYIEVDKQLSFIDNEFDSLPQDFVAIERSEAETNENYKQIIPYCVVFCKESVLRYVRAGDETRLHNLYSIGLGGHVHEGENPYTGIIRELKEEIGVTCDPILVGYVNEEITPVGRVHFGALYAVEIDGPMAFDKELKEPELVHYKELSGVKYELWSEMAVENIAEIHDTYCQVRKEQNRL